MDFLQDVSGKKLDWKAMQDAGIDPATSVTFQVEKTTFGKAVSCLFVIAGADAEPEVVVDPKGTVVVKPAAKRKYQAGFQPAQNKPAGGCLHDNDYCWATIWGFLQKGQICSPRACG